MNNIVLLKENGEIFTTSLLIAEKFDKRHDTVIRKIEKLPDNEFTRRNFEVSYYKDKSGKQSKMYELTRDGFSLLAIDQLVIFKHHAKTTKPGITELWRNKLTGLNPAAFGFNQLLELTSGNRAAFNGL